MGNIIEGWKGRLTIVASKEEHLDKGQRASSEVQNDLVYAPPCCALPLVVFP